MDNLQRHALSRTTNLEVFKRSLGLGTPINIVRNIDLAHSIRFNSTKEKGKISIECALHNINTTCLYPAAFCAGEEDEKDFMLDKEFTATTPEDFAATAKRRERD